MRISGSISFILFLFFIIPPVIARGTVRNESRTDTIPKVENNFGTSFEKGLYKAVLDISKHHLSGFMYLKRTSDSSYRIIFSSEVGMKYFDFEFRGKEFIIQYCFPSLEKKSLLKLLENDFRVLLFPFQELKRITLVAGTSDSTDFKIKAGHGKWIYRILNDTRRIIRMDSKGKLFGKTKVNVEYSDHSPSSIIIINPTIRLSLKMKLINP